MYNIIYQSWNLTCATILVRPGDEPAATSVDIVHRRVLIASRPTYYCRSRGINQVPGTSYFCTRRFRHGKRVVPEKYERVWRVSWPLPPGS